jgi:glutathione S-transferase
MITVLRRLREPTMLDAYSNLAVFVARGEMRPAFKRAFDARLAVFRVLTSCSRSTFELGVWLSNRYF